ncbi:hypothetical protein DAPPUDRAFT_106059 [Daphnia pulex]|uniref:Uncharacterized protein n=1 Tax=Daphnia pulex TaxID=6669 RepID=E9GSM4_DAPPU|nr:hypothetical protein DAPPUDRAFT_106059 [Daphnia pulex]|eukprot:EFX77555.1 hypothetical protein DAPPUDRAFT_106059 [Daphnia pulex]
MTNFEKVKNALSKVTKLKPDFTMMNEKVKKAFSKSTKFLSANKEVIVFLMLLIIAWTFLLCFVKLPPDLQDMSGKPIKVTCNDDKINYPMAPIKNPTKKNNYFIHEIGASCICLLLSFLYVRGRRLANSDPPCSSIILLLVQLLLWILSLITGSVFTWLWVNNGPTETLAPNFLAACKPQGLDLLCSPDSHPEDWNPVVWVTCTTPPEMWIPALSNALPPLAAVQAYLTFAAVIYMIYNWKWEGPLTLLTLCHLPVSIMSFGFIVYFAISDNVANFDKEFFSGYLKSFAVACVWLAVDSFWQKTKKEPTLPRHWNDPTPQTGPIPTNLTPSLHEPPAATGSTTRETENAYQSIYPDLTPEYENPPSYGSSATRY